MGAIDASSAYAPVGDYALHFRRCYWEPVLSLLCQARWDPSTLFESSNFSLLSEIKCIRICVCLTAFLICSCGE